MTWFSWVAWSVRADLLRSVKLDARRLVVKVRPVLDSTSVLCSCNLTPNFSSSFADVGLVTVGTRNFVHTFC